MMMQADEALPSISAVFLFSTEESIDVTILADRTHEELDKRFRAANHQRSLLNEAERLSNSPDDAGTRLVNARGDFGEFALHRFEASELDIVVFLCDHSQRTCEETKSDSPLQAMPYLDGALLNFLSSDFIWKKKSAKKSALHRRNSSRTRRQSMLDASSHEEIFRILDASGEGYITEETFAEGLDQLGIECSPEEVHTVFKHITTRFAAVMPRLSSLGSASDLFDSATYDGPPDDTPVITQNQFSSFMHSGQRMMRKDPTSPQRRRTHFSIDENEMDAMVVDKLRAGLLNSFGQNNPTTLSNVSAPVERLQKCDELLQIFEGCVFRLQVDDHIRWQNRFLAHKERLTNFRTMLNQKLSEKVKSMQEQHDDLIKQLNGRNRPNGIPSSPSGGLDSIDDLLSPSARSPSRPRGLRSLSHLRGDSVSSLDFVSDDGSEISDTDYQQVSTPGGSLRQGQTQDLLGRMKREIKKLRKDRQKLKNELKQHITVYENKISKLTSKLKDSQRDKTDLLDMQTQVRKQMLSARKANSRRSIVAEPDTGAQRTIATLRRKLAEAERLLSETENSNEILKSKLSRANAKRQQTQSLEGATTVSQRKVTRLQSRISELEAELSTKSRRIDAMFLELTALRQRYDQQTEELATTKASIGGMRRKMQEVEMQYDALQQEKRDSRASEHEVVQLTQLLQENEEKLERIKSRAGRMRGKVRELLAKIDELQRLQMEASRLRRDLSDLENRKRELERQRAESSERNKELEDRIASLEAEIASKSNELENTSSALEEYADTLSREQALLQELQGLQEQVADKDLAVEDAEESRIQLARIRSEKESKERECARLQEKYDNAKRNIAEQAQYRSTLRTQNDSLMEEVTHLRLQVQSHQNEIDLLSTRRQESDRQANETQIIRKHLQDATDQVIELQATIDETQNRVLEKESLIAERGREYAELLDMFESAKRERDSKDTMVRRLKEKVTALEETSMQYDDEVASKVRQYEVQIVTIEENSKQIEHLQQQLTLMRDERDMASENLTRTEEVLNNVRLELSNNEDELTAKLKKIEKLRRKLEISGAGRNKGNSELELLRRNVEEMDSIMRTKDFEIRKLTNQLQRSGVGGALSEARAQVSRLRAKVEELEQAQSSTSLESTSIASERDALHDQLSKRSAEISQLRGQLEEIQSENEGLFATQNTKGENVRRLQSELQEVQAQMSALQSELEDAQREARRVGKRDERIRVLEGQIVDRDAQISDWRLKLERAAARAGEHLITVDEDEDEE